MMTTSPSTMPALFIESSMHIQRKGPHVFWQSQHVGILCFRPASDDDAEPCHLLAKSLMSEVEPEQGNGAELASSKHGVVHAVR